MRYLFLSTVLTAVADLLVLVLRPFFLVGQWLRYTVFPDSHPIDHLWFRVLFYVCCALLNFYLVYDPRDFPPPYPALIPTIDIAQLKGGE